MRIAYLCADFGIPIRGYKGASVHVREMVAALTANGHDVRVFTPNPGQGNLLAAPMTHISPDGLSRACGRLAGVFARGRLARLDREVRELAYNITLHRRLSAELERWRPDAMYERYSLFNLAGLAAARRLRIPHLLEVNAPLRLERVRAKGLALNALAGWVERRLFGGSDAVLVVSSALREYVLERDASPERTLVLPNGVDTRRFHPRARDMAVRTRLGLPDDALVIGFTGSLKPWHGVETLLDAYAALQHFEPSARLLIVGEGPQGDTLRRHAAHLGIDDRTVFTGKVAHDEMPALLATMDIGVAPYLHVPDFYFSPLKLYEYMASGLAVIGSEAGEIPSLIRDGHTGLLCPPGDAAALARALTRLARGPELRRQLGAAARTEAERHTWDGNARTVARLAAEPRVQHDRPVARPINETPVKPAQERT